MASRLPLPLNSLRGVALGIGLAFSISTASFAACSPGTAPPQKVSDFMANPSSLLGGGSRSSSEVTSDVRDLVVSDPATLPAIIGLLKGSPPPSSDMQKAIGTGLGLGASICIRPDPTFAAEIQSQLAGTNSTDAKQQYAAVTGNQLIGAVGGRRRWWCRCRVRRRFGRPGRSRCRTSPAAAAFRPSPQTAFPTARPTIFRAACRASARSPRSAPPRPNG